MARAYVPDTAEVIWLEFDPQAGHEQARHRPALVISPSTYNGKTGLMVGCPMTTNSRAILLRWSPRSTELRAPCFPIR